jgi:hypothetical protein
VVAEAVQVIVPTTVDKAAKVVVAAAHLDMMVTTERVIPMV